MVPMRDLMRHAVVAVPIVGLVAVGLWQASGTDEVAVGVDVPIPSDPDQTLLSSTTTGPTTTVVSTSTTVPSGSTTTTTTETTALPISTTTAPSPTSVAPADAGTVIHYLDDDGEVHPDAPPLERVAAPIAPLAVMELLDRRVTTFSGMATRLYDGGGYLVVRAESCEPRCEEMIPADMPAVDAFSPSIDTIQWGYEMAQDAYELGDLTRWEILIDPARGVLVRLEAMIDGDERRAFRVYTMTIFADPGGGDVPEPGPSQPVGVV